MSRKWAPLMPCQITLMSMSSWLVAQRTRESPIISAEPKQVLKENTTYYKLTRWPHYLNVLKCRYKGQSAWWLGQWTNRDRANICFNCVRAPATHTTNVLDWNTRRSSRTGGPNSEWMSTNVITWHLGKIKNFAQNRIKLVTGKGSTVEMTEKGAWDWWADV